MFEALVSGATLGVLSLPHCVAMCGPLAAYACTNAADRAPALRYQLGRTLAYAFLGAVCGRLGQVMTTAGGGPWPRLVFSLLAAAACVLTARKLWRREKTPAPLVQLRNSRSVSPFAVLAKIVPAEPAVLALLTGFLPCGALATALVAASATSSAAAGTLLMLGFVTASAPALLGMSVLTRAWPATSFARLQRPLAVAFAVCALLFVARPLAAMSTASAAPQASHAKYHCH